MTSFVTNARRDQRLPMRLEVQLAVSSVGHQGHTEDVGASGCRLLVPMRLPAGSRVRLLLLPAGAAGSLSIGATVIWSTEAPGWRHGLAFATADAGRAAAWFDELIAGTTRILHLDRGPDRIGPGDRIYVARAPQEPTTSEEALVLRLASARVSMAELCAAFGARWSRIPRALLSLLDRGLVAIEREGTGATGR